MYYNFQFHILDSELIKRIVTDIERHTDFQFHILDSGIYEHSGIPIYVIDTLSIPYIGFLKENGFDPTRTIVFYNFQFHILDSTRLAIAGSMIGEIRAFNSIYWIQLIEEKDYDAMAFINFQFHILDSMFSFFGNWGDPDKYNLSIPYIGFEGRAIIDVAMGGSKVFQFHILDSGLWTLYSFLILVSIYGFRVLSTIT